ncbi:MAG: DUF11 domain-containing protein, partial [Caldilineales bacterium]|nr:DUF11 domain-containing protein [Caldilineales bacterium]
MAGGQRREQGRSEADEEAASLTVDIGQEAEPAVVAPGEVVTYTVTARHTGYGLLRDLVVSDALPAGLVLVPHSESGFGYDPGAKALIWEIESLGPGATMTGTFQARVTGAAIGAVIVNEALASSRTITQTVIGQSVVEVAPPKGNRAAVAAGQGGWLRSEDGRVQVHLPPGAVNRQVEISYAEADMTLPDFLRHAFVLTAKDGNGEEVTDFGQPVEVVYRYTAQELVERDLNAASLYHWDEARGEWEVVPSTLEVGRGRLRAQLQHFSIYAEGGAEDTYLVEGQTTLRGAQPQLFTGAIGYSYDFRLPPGQGGLQPVLGLRYSSASHTPNSGHFSQVGFGWELAGADWLYIPPGDQNATQPTLKLQGATYSLRQTGDGQWFAKEDPLLKIEALDCSFGACGEWRLHGRDGVEYTFGTAETSRSYYWKLCGQQGEGRRYVHLPLRRITDRAGNTVSFSWGEEVEPSGPGACWPKSYVRAIHLDRIEYDNSNVQIDFVYAPRLDFPEGYDQQLWRFYTQNRLQQLWVKAKSGGSYQTLRSYYLEYDSGPNPYVSQKVSNLTFIEQTANGQVMPRVEFGYSDSGFASQDEYGAMTWIKNGYGGEIAFSSDHRGSGATPHVLASMSLRSGMAGATEAVWRYQGYDWDASGEADKLAGGFKRMDVIGPDGSLTRYEFETILDVGGKFDHLAGRVKTVQVCDDANCGSGHVLSRLETTWLHQLPANYPHLSNYGSLAAKDQPKFVYKEVEIAFKGEEEQSKTVLKYQDFRQKDEANVSRQYGNLTEMQEIEWDANTGGWKSAPYRTTYSVFYPATSAWIIDKPGLQEVFRKTWDDPSGQRLVQTFLFYDQTSNYQARPSQGLLRRTQTGLGSLWQDTYFEYWSHGSLYKTTDALGGSTRTFYDPDFGAYVLCQENALGQEVQYRYYGVSGGNRVGADGASCNPTSGSGIDAANGRVFGALEEEKDANGAITTYSYDRWQRLVGVWRPGESKAAGHGASERVVYPAFMGGGAGGYAAPFVVRSGRRDDAGGGAVASYLESWRVYDGLGQVIQTQTEAATSGQRNVVDVWYDGQGRRVKESIAYAAAAAGDVSISPQAQAHTDYAYDGLGRTTTITNTDLSVTRSFYSAVAGGERTAVIDANQHQTIREVDGFGRLKWSRQYEGSFGAGPNWSATVYAEAAYGYDEFDRLAAVTGPGNEPTSLTYDALGRKTSLTDADMGLWSYGYDAAGNLTRQTDARGTVLCYEYDALNRLRYVREDQTAPKDCTGTLAWRTTHEYDTLNWQPVANGIGRRNRLNDGSGTTTWAYDVRGRATSETKAIGGT